MTSLKSRRTIALLKVWEVLEIWMMMMRRLRADDRTAKVEVTPSLMDELGQMSKR